MSQHNRTPETSGHTSRRIQDFWLPALALVVLIAAGALAFGSQRRNPVAAPSTAMTTTPPADAGVAPGTESPVVAAAAPAPAEPLPAPRAAVAPEPRPADLIIPSGSAVTLKLDEAITTKTAQAGDRFTAHVVNPVMVAGHVAIPRNALISGRIIVAEQPGKASGRGRLQFAFDSARFSGHSVSLNSRSALFQSRSGAKKDRELIGGGAAAGGVLGGVLGGSLGDAAKGAVIGGAAGGAVSLMTRGPQLEFSAGTQIRFTLDQPVTVPAGATS